MQHTVNSSHAASRVCTSHSQRTALRPCLPLTPWAPQRLLSTESQSTPKRDLALLGSQHL